MRRVTTNTDSVRASIASTIRATRIFLLVICGIAVVSSGCVRRVKEADLLPGARAAKGVPQGTVPNLLIAASDGSTLRGYAFTSPDSRFAMVYFGGNGEIIQPNSPIAALARRHHFDAYAVNYRGFGPSEGAASLGAILSDSLKIFDFVAARPELQGRPILVYGFSIGSIAALEVATQRTVAGVILQSAPSAASAVIPTWRPLLPWFARPFVWLRADEQVAAFRPQPIDLANRVTAPLLAIHGTADRIIAIRFGEEVFAAAPSANKTFCRIEGGDHNDLWSVGGEQPHQCLDAFLEGIAGGGRSGG